MQGALSSLRVVALVMGLSVTSGCHLIFPFGHDAPAPGPDAGAADLGPAPDLRVDAADAALPPADSAGDVADAALPRGDGPLQDLPPTDLPPPDQQIYPDGPPFTACEAVTILVFWWNAKMAVCGGLTAWGQCNAEKNCNVAGGWHLCRPDEYVQHGGGTTPPSSQAKNAWLAGCSTRNATSYPFPTNTICPCASPVSAPSTGATYNCWTQKQVKSANVSYLGLHTELDCYTLGAPSGQQAHWGLSSPTGLLSKYSVCCAP